MLVVFYADLLLVNWPKVRRNKGRRFETGAEGSKINLQRLENPLPIGYTPCESM